MLTYQTYLKKTKRGNILKIVREHYLRDDIWCGSKLCDSCRHKNKEAVLEKAPKSESTLFPESHYLVLDTNVVLDQIDVLEEDCLSNVIILQTVLKEVKHRSSTVFKRLRDIIANTSRKFYVFVNEHHKETYIERNQGESINDRNDRAVRLATNWYAEHLNKAVKIILLSDDKDNRQKAQNEGISALSAEEYITSLPSATILLDKLSKKEYSTEGGMGGEPLFPPHYTPQEIHEGIKKKTLLHGVFQSSRENFLEGNVSIEGQDMTVLVQGRESLNRAVDGDTVAVKLLPEDQWVGSSELILQDEDEEDDLKKEEIIKREASKKIEKKPTGVIVGILKRKWRQYCGILQPNPVAGSVKHIFVPSERKIPKVRIETRQSDVLSSQRIIVAIDSWPRYSRYPLGHFVRALGPIGDKETENEVLLLEHDVPHSKFSEAVLSFLPKLPWTITEEDLKQRQDLRHLDICSVDPPGCTDIDDALHCLVLANGNFEVGVHIADVSHFIRPGNALDKEAALRATTVYLVDKRIDMVPELLSSNLCSLREQEDRFAFSCIWEMTENAEIINTKFHKSIIKSRRAMTYEEAQIKIDDSTQTDSITLSLRRLNALAKVLKKKRIDKGSCGIRIKEELQSEAWTTFKDDVFGMTALQLNLSSFASFSCGYRFRALVLASPEIRFHVDSETHDPIDVEAKKIRETNSMVEEFMLLANISVAEKIVADFPECALLRRHPQPPLSNFEPLLKAGRIHGFEILVDTGKNLADSLDKAVKPDNVYFNTMLRILATRCMMQALYFSSGMLQPEDYFHYGLACPLYTHFTSPIRRYADIIVHRLLAVSIGADSTYTDLLDRRKTQELCFNLNYRHRMAQYAGRASVAFHTHLFFRERVQDEEGYVLYVRKNGLQILIPKYGLEGYVYVSGKKELDTTGFVFDDENQTLRCGKIIFRAFDPVTVQLSLDRTNVQHEKLVFQLVHPKIPNFSVPSQNGKRKVEEEKTRQSKSQRKS